MQPWDRAIVGAGIHGLCTAFWSVRSNCRRVIVLERHDAGHELGSSHGQTRITRSTYADPQHVELAVRAHGEGWPAVEREVGRALRVATPGLFFGPPDGAMAGYVAAATSSRGVIEQLPAALAQRRFPLLRIAPDDAVLLDHSAAMVLAADTMRSLREWLADNGVELAWRTPVHGVQRHHDGVELATDRGPIVARSVVLACGPWTGRLHGAVPPVCVLRQEVGYVDLDVPAAACRAGRFPVWARIGRTADDFTYGLPEHAGGGVKIAMHRTEGDCVDPDVVPPPIDTDALLALARRHFAVPVRGLRAAERCLDTLTGDQRFHVARAPDLPLVHVVACSGHAFKFGPVIGRAAAELAAATA